MTGLPVLRSVGLSIGYPLKQGNKVIADSLDLELKKGELLCLVGPNGVGKSTLVRTLAGVIKRNRETCKTNDTHQT